MKKVVRCLTNRGGGNYLTVGKLYNVVREEHNQYIVLNDVGWEASYDVCAFEVVKDGEDTFSSTKNKYSREIAKGVWIDVYDVLRAFEVTDPCLQHLVKKALAVGKRGHKDAEEDYRDILASSKRALEMYVAWNNEH
jgi:hypothetical protein